MNITTNILKREMDIPTNFLRREINITTNFYSKGKEIKMENMNNIIKILMERDDITYEEATEIYYEARTALMDAITGTNGLTPEEVLMGELGLEMDYIFDVL